MKNKLNKQLLNEELKRFKLLCEYSFITQGEDEKDDLILGSLDEADEDPAAPTDEMGGELGSELSGDAQAPDQLPTDEPPMDDASMEEPMPEPSMDQPVETGDGEVEVDVTSIVKGSEEAKLAADEASRKSEMLLDKFSELENMVRNMTTISDRIDNLEKEFVKRNPTPVEKLEMRSLDSYPFNQKLTDFWSGREGMYDVMDKKDDEYVLTKSDVDYDYSDASIRQTFEPKDDDNEYYEEEI